MEKSISLYSLMLQTFIDKEPIHKIPADTILFQEEDPVENIYLVLSGTISIGRVHMKGKEFIMKLLNGEEMIIEYEMFRHNPRYHFTSKALTDCELIIIKKDAFEDYVSNNKTAMNSLLNWLSTRYLKAQMKCQDLIMNGKKGDFIPS